MDDPLLVGVLHGLADRDGQLEPLAKRQPALVAELGDRDALDQLHHEVGASLLGGAGVEHLGDVGVVHQGQRLAFRTEAGQDLAAVHAGLDELQRHRAPHRLGLLGHVDRAHPTLADRLEELVGADHRAGVLVICRIDGGAIPLLEPYAPEGRWVNRGGLLEEAADQRVRRQQPIHLAAQVSVAAAGLGQIGGALGWVDLCQGGEENGFGGRHLGHGRPPHGVASPS